MRQYLEYSMGYNDSFMNCNYQVLTYNALKIASWQLTVL